MKYLILLFTTSVSWASSDDCKENLAHVVGPVVGFSVDGDPIYKNLGPVVGADLDGTPVYAKVGVPAPRIDRHGIVTGHTYDGDPLYDHEKSPKYSIDGDREYPRDKPKNGYDP